jgi:hypothetical protein
VGKPDGILGIGSVGQLKGSLSLSDLVRSLHIEMPGAFQSLDADKPTNKPAGTMTERMRQEIDSTRQQRRLPDDWRETRARYAAGTITAQHLAEREENWK